MPAGALRDIIGTMPAQGGLRTTNVDGGVASATYFNDANKHALAWRADGSELGDPASALYIARGAWSAPVNFGLVWPGAGESNHGNAGCKCCARTCAGRRSRDFARLAISASA